MHITCLALNLKKQTKQKKQTTKEVFIIVGIAGYIIVMADKISNLLE